MQWRQCCGIEAYFDYTLARKELKQYRKNGPRRETRILIEALKTDGIEGMTLLDIGGGVGAIQHELLANGVSSATNVDASMAYIETAMEEAERLCNSDRVSYNHGNFVDLAGDIEPADIVTLDSVICCYYDMEALVGSSSRRARRLYGFVYPRDTWWMRIAFAGMNFCYWARRSQFRVFLHPMNAIEAVVRGDNFKRRFYRRTSFWHIVVYGR